MNQYLVEAEIKATWGEDLAELLPRQKVHLHQLMNDGTLTFYCIAQDQSKVWASIQAASEKEALELIEAMPMSNFISVTLHELALSELAGAGLPAISLN